MKKLILIGCLVTAVMMAGAQNPPDYIYAHVNGNNVTLWDVGSFRNCCAYYEMIVVQDDMNLKWLQNDIGDACYCMCNFDLFVVLGPLSPGEYSVDVYYTEVYSGEEYYVGSTTFVINAPASFDNDTLEIITAYQSDCYNYTELSETLDTQVKINLFPNPVSASLKCELSAFGSPRLSIYNLLGTEVKSFVFYEAGTYGFEWDLTDVTGNRIPSGLYIFVLESGNTRISGKIQVLE